MTVTSGSTRSFFETRIFTVDLLDMEALNAELERLVLAEAVREPGLVASNRGGWHSLPDLAQRPGTPYRALCDRLATYFQRVTEEAARAVGLDLPPYRLGLTAWAMAMGPGHYATLHDHAESTWSSVYYVNAGDPAPPTMPSAGVLAFVDPRRATPTAHGVDLFPTSFEVTPRTGRLVIFPGYLQHHVHPYLGQRPRISIAANAVVHPAPPSP